MERLIEWINRQALSTKLKWTYLVTSGGVMFLSTLFLIGIQLYFFTAALVRQTQSQATMVGENLTAAMAFADVEAAGDILAALRVAPDVQSAVAYDARGKAFVSFRRDPNDPPDTAPAAPDPHARADTVLDYRGVSVTRRIRIGTRQLGTVVVRSSVTSVYRQLALYLALALPVMLALLSLSYFTLSRLQRFFTAPIFALSAVSEQISRQGDYSLRAEVPAAADIGLLTRTFNGMLDRIQKRESELEAEINERKRIEVKLDRLAHYDPVTQLNNRHFFNERLEAVIARARKFDERTILMFIDLDNFKTVNDTLGHDIGDELLRLVSRRLSETLRFGDVLSRIGGDEFGIILENVSQVRVAALIAEKCLAKLADPIHIHGHDIHIGASIGISVYPDDATDMHALLKYADTAMYYAKNGGKNAWRMFTPSMRDDAHKRFKLDNNLRRALERNEFVLHYQPQVDLKSGAIVGVEALIRWIHPQLGMVSPSDFIPIAEDTGLIVPIGELKESRLVAAVLATLREADLEPCWLELELTESMLMDASTDVVDRLHALTDAGIQLAIDDFGTGYSSMSYLKTFPVRALKVDKSFVRGLPQNPEDAAITRAIIAMARSLRMEIVAEGIETQEQHDFLRAHGCDKSQGYLYGRPCPAAQLGQMLGRSRACTVD
ncbi:MAG: EAL domain-containing protein [Massilia sp.]|nr:EAL domain-containing protein [Massilia sp.]